MTRGQAEAETRTKDVKEAMARVPREEFVLPQDRSRAYADRPLDIGFNVTISQPYIVERTLEEARIREGERVLEIGTGSGYQTAILRELGAEVFTMELISELSKRAQATLGQLNYHDVHFRIGDGYEGWPEEAPFDRIILSAAPAEIPDSLLQQLSDGGILVGPEGNNDQWLVRIHRKGDKFHRERLLRVRFVPMVRDA